MNPIPNQESRYQWPGWPLEHDPHGEHFDLEARKRMIKGSLQLETLLNKYEEKIGSFILEIGPFFAPLITHSKYPNSIIFYWENDKYVIESIDKQNAYALPWDLKNYDGDTVTKLHKNLKDIFKRYGMEKVQFDSVVVSQVFNYIDYKFLLILLKLFVKPNGYLFINNVVDYGLPMYFSDHRPKSIADTIKTLKERNYEIVEQKTIISPYPEHQKNKRLLVVAKNKLCNSFF